MRNATFFEKIIVIGFVGVLVLALWQAGGITGVVGPVVVLALVYLYFHSGTRATQKALAQVAHVNNVYSSAVQGTGIGIAYEKGESRPVLLVSSNGNMGCYAPHQLRSVGLKDDRKGIYRNILLMIKDGDCPQWLIHFKSQEEAAKWKERITQFAENGGRQ